MQFGGTVMARNLMDGPTVLSSDPKGTFEVRWEGKGDRNGGDIQYIPDEMLRIPAFARAIKLGVIEIANPEDNPELLVTLNKQAEAFHRLQEKSQEDIRATIDNTKGREMVTLPCVGPSAKGQGDCGELVSMYEAEKNDNPPLCHRHTSLASEFVPVNEGQDERENKKVRWIRGVMSDTPIGLQV
jgi:hypothetical protein